jgi:hypothetical protein
MNNLCEKMEITGGFLMKKKYINLYNSHTMADTRMRRKDGWRILFFYQ